MNTKTSSRSRRAERSTNHWKALPMLVAMLSVAGVALAAGTNQGMKLQPPNHDPRNSKIRVVTAEPGPLSEATTGAHSGGGPLSPPSNDDCTGAIVIPSGSLPYTTAPVDVTDATPQGTDDPQLCAANGVERTIWFSFTPAVSGNYVFSTCNGSTTVYDTVIGIVDACPAVTSLGCNDTVASCAQAIPGAPYIDLSTQSAVLTAGNTYYIGAGHWDGAGDAGGVQPGFNQIAVSVRLSAAPSNDTCASPTPLALDHITLGTTASATNDYRTTNPGGSGANAACFSGVGQLPTTSNGADIVFSFTAPDSDTYSFRYVMDDSGAALRSQSPVLYLASNCPAPDPSGVNPPNCIAAANRRRPDDRQRQPRRRNQVRSAHRRNDGLPVLRRPVHRQPRRPARGGSHAVPSRSRAERHARLGHAVRSGSGVLLHGRLRYS